MAYAVKYLTDQGRSADVPIARVIEGKEPKAFWDVFRKNKNSGGANSSKSKALCK